MRGYRWVVAVLVGLVALQTWAGQNDWTHLGRDASRQSIAADGPTILDANAPGWIVKTDPNDPNHQIEFEGATGPVLYAGKVFAYARCGDSNSQVAAWDAASGRLLWSSRIDPAQWGSCSTPAIDTRHNTLLIGSGIRLFAIDANDGTSAWKTPTELNTYVVNASICTAVDLPHARAFITDYDGFGGSGRLYCINLDASEPNNPFEPGQIVWHVPLGDTSGNSPSYANGTVYVANGDGHLFAFDAAASKPNLIWETYDPGRIKGVFLGGVTVTTGGYLYAASYNWDLATGQNNSTLVKLDCRDGRIVWTTAAERTDTIPVVAGDMIFLSGGLADYGSKPKVQAFHDLGDSAELLWDTAVALPDITLGDWLAQPVYANGKFYVGTQEKPYDADYNPNGNSQLFILDATRNPAEAGFIVAFAEGCGNSPAVTPDSVYSVGPNALMRFCQPRPLPDAGGNSDAKYLEIRRTRLAAPR